jgi:hypothetical protein
MVEENRVGSQIQSQSMAVARDVAKGHAIAVNDDSVLISKKGLLAFMVEAMWRVQMVLILIVIRLSGVGSRGGQLKQGAPDFPFPGHIDQL